VIGAVLIIVVLVLVLPALFLITGAVLSGVLGWLLKSNGETTHEGSELVDLYY
jgi:hypothetical protein